MTMERCTYKDGDHNEHFVIKKNISIEFQEHARKSSKTLAIFCNGKSFIAKANAPDNERQWTLENEICVAPDRNDLLTFRVAYQKKGLRGVLKGRKDEFVDIKLALNNIVQELKEKNETKINVSEASCTVSLVVARGDIVSNIVGDSMEDLKPVLPNSFQDIIASCTDDAFLQNIKCLSSVLENIPVTEDALSAIETTMNKIGEAHPFAKAVLTALSIPYNLLRNETQFKQNVKDLAETMHFTCKCVVDIRYHTRIASAKASLVSIMETLRNAALYLNKYADKGKIGQFMGAQFPAELEGYAEELIKQKNRFRMAMIIQIARDVDMIASMTVDDFLRKHLDPVKDDEQPNGCLEGTRTKILNGIRDWLQDRDSDKNILWLQGPPGAGKSTIATTIAQELAKSTPYCATFSCNRDFPQLRNPRNIWPTIAFDLASKHDGVKAALMAKLNEKKGGLRYESVSELFETLIRSPLDTDWKETRFRSHRPAYPVVIIDALDECNTDGERWQSFLSSLVSWANLCGVGLVKLIITSRQLQDISARLGGLSYLVSLTAGDDVSDDGKADVEVFFKSKFAEIRASHGSKPHGLYPEWPGERSINKLTDYAAGLFIWADMVVKYVAPRAGGSDPVERLQAVLSDVETRAGIDGASRVDRLFARIIFEAFQHSIGAERVRAKSALAAIMLAKRPLRIVELIDLQSTDTWDARHAIESTLRMLSPIIPTCDIDDYLRVCHKTVPDFLLSRPRNKAAMEYVVDGWNAQNHKDRIADVHSFLIDPRVEERNFALACMRLLCRNFAKNADNTEKLPKYSNESFEYAFDHWHEHLRDAAAGRIAPVLLKHLIGSMKFAYGCLKQFIGKLVLVKEVTSALITSLRGAADLVIQCIDHVNTVELSDVESFQQEVTMCARNLDIARGKFQIAMIEDLTSQSSDSFLRKRLEPSEQTFFDNPCMEGTRTSVLQRAKNWLEDTTQPNILWIVGAPGAGKSAIATSLVGDFSSGAGRLCAKAFAKRDFEDRRDPTRIWRTLAYDMASLHAGLKGSIMQALLGGLQTPRNAAEDRLQLRGIIVKALKEQQCLSVVFVVDALDECFNEDNEQWRALLETLSTCTKLPLKLVITSRDIPEIRDVLDGISSSLRLEAGPEYTAEEAKSDMKNFYRTKFEETLWQEDAKEARMYWTQADIIHRLSENADSFIWAKMVVDLVKLNPRSRLDDILNYAGKGASLKVDAVYAKILFDVLGQVHEKDREIFRLVIAFVILAKNPLREVDLVDLLRASPSILYKNETLRLVTNVVKELSSVISIGDNELVRIPHKSFADFLLDDNRSSEAISHILPTGYDHRSFIVNREEDIAKFTIACLQLMNNALRFNAYGIKTSHALNDEIQGLEGHISKHIGTSLIYACRFWAEHLNDCSRDDHYQRLRGQVGPLLEKLLNENLLYWLEILSLSKSVPSADRSLWIARGILKEYCNESAEVAKDARSFVNMFEKPIAAAASHIYLSALPFCPLNSRIARIYGPQYLNTLSVTKGRQINWGLDTGAIIPDTHTNKVQGVAFFPDGRRLASGSSDNTVRIWDSKTGRALSAQLTGRNRLAVWGVAVSPDGNKIASGDVSGTLRIWDSNTGTSLSAFNAHNEAINSLSFSPDGSRVVTGSSDKTVKVWNVTTGSRCLIMTVHTEDVRSVAFSNNGTAIASGSNDKTIRIWDAFTGVSRSRPLTAHTRQVRCVAFSPDGRFLASGSDDKTIRLWDVVREFSPMGTITVGSEVRSVCFSPNSDCLVSGSADGTLCFWNITEQTGVTIFGHSQRVWSVAFSPDGQFVASGSWDCSIKIWSMPSSCVQPTATSEIKGENASSVDFNPARESFDSRGCPILTEESFIDEDGWMHASWRGGADRLFWVPEINRECVWWPRNIAVIHPYVTKFDFRRFVHGENWTQCRTDADVV